MMENDQKWIRISDLEKRSGISRRTIHFYLQEGLIHQPLKTGKTMAYYDETHLKKLLYIKKEKQRGMPLFAIRKKLLALEVDNAVPYDPLTIRRIQNDSSQQGSIKSPPSKSRGKKTREKILNLSCMLFRQKGYRDTKISDITKELNIGKGTFYFYFADKRDLFFECIPRIFLDLFGKGWDKIRQADDPLERLQLRARTVLPALREFCVIIQLSKEAMESSDPRLRKLGQETYLSIRKPLEYDIEKGVQQGIFQAVDPKIVSTIMVGIMESLYYLQTTDKQVVSVEILNSALEVILSGVKGDRPD